jgi:hypothetical protein
MANSLNKKIIYYFVFSLLTLNALMFFVIKPNIQKQVNSHLAKGDYVSIFIFLLAFVLLILSMFFLFSIKKRKIGFFLLIMSINLFFWTPLIFSIQCKGCSIA